MVAQHWFQIRYPDGTYSDWQKCSVMKYGSLAGSFYVPETISERGEVTICVSDKPPFEENAMPESGESEGIDVSDLRWLAKQNPETYLADKVTKAADEIERLRAEMARHAKVCCGELRRTEPLPALGSDWPWWPTAPGASSGPPRSGE